ncbi:MAG: hypothetical protein DRQ55_02575 [Planctomycetota bacterium]|nr:MAG: hypothetical protein DRQ55_02575 [Planctomycetota bacterium]
MRGGSGRTTGAVITPVASGGDALDTWEAWWDHNQDAFLDLKAARIDARTVSGSPGQLTGRGRKRTATTVQRVGLAQIDDELVPALLPLSAPAQEREILNSVTLALGRMVGPARRHDVVKRLETLIGHSELQVRASAVLGLGTAGGQSSDDTLLALLHDDSAGRQLVGGGRVDTLVRGISALSLGLKGNARSVWSLMDAVTRLPDSEREVKASAVAALGLLPAEHPRSQVAAVLLVDLLSDESLDPVVASVIPTTLGKMQARESLPVILALLQDRRANGLVRQSCAIAAGQLGSLADGHALDALLAQVAEGRDRATRHFALIALGQLGARGGDDAEAHDRLRRALLRELSGQGASSEHRAWAALALGLYGRGQPLARPALIGPLMAAWDDEHDPSFRGAFALSAGLLGHAPAAARMRLDLHAADSALAGHAALALSLLDERASLPAIRGLLQRPGATPALRTRAATALALLADTDSIPALVQVLSEGATYDEQAAVSKALGLLGDRSALPPLLELALDTDAALRDRGFACVALGLLGERTRLPFHAALRADTNYLARIDPLVQVAQIP